MSLQEYSEQQMVTGRRWVTTRRSREIGCTRRRESSRKDAWGVRGGGSDGQDVLILRGVQQQRLKAFITTSVLHHHFNVTLGK